MYTKLFILTVMGVIIMSIFGCRQENRFEYESVKYELYGGELYIYVVGRIGDPYKENGRKKIDYGGPYHVVFEYTVNPEDELKKIIIRNIELIGEKSGQVYAIDDIENDRVSVYGERKFIRSSTGLLVSNNEFEYENFAIHAELAIYKNQFEPHEHDVSVVLKTDYKKEFRNDWIDRMLAR